MKLPTVKCYICSLEVEFDFYAEELKVRCPKCKALILEKRGDATHSTGGLNFS